MPRKRRIYWLVLVVVLLLGFVTTVTTPPLSGVHGDSVIYVYHGKRFAETDFLADYSRSASAIAANVEGASLGDSGFWSPYWHFTRLGHMMVVGSVVTILGTNVHSIVALQWIFAGLITLAALLAVANAYALAESFDTALYGDTVLLGGIVSAALFLLSEIFGYLGRSIVSETPTAAILAAATLTFLVGQKRRSLAWSAASGLLAFLLYVVRAEAIWPYLVFLTVLAGSQWRLRLSHCWNPGYAAALFSALACWIGYLAWMFPLPDPRLFLALARLSDIDPGEVSVHRLSGSIGLLLVGVVLNLAIAGRRRTWVIPIVWSALALLPSVPYLLGGRSVQTRMFVPYLMLPAFVASTFGWAKLFSAGRDSVRRVGGWVAGVVTCLLVMISVPTLYDFVHSLPGLWRVQAVRELAGPWLHLPAWEEHTYEPREVSEAAQAVVHDGRRGPVVADDGVDYGNLYLLRFFMERYPSSARMVMQGEPVSQLTCPSEATVIERHRYCSGLASTDLVRLVHASGGLFLMESSAGRKPEADPYREFGKTLVYAGRNLRIWYLEPNTRAG